MSWRVDSGLVRVGDRVGVRVSVYVLLRGGNIEVGGAVIDMLSAVVVDLV